MDRFDVTRRLLCEHLPADVVECVVHHARRDASARAVQARWRRVSSVGHARRPGWSDVRQCLGEDAWRRLVPYELVRREWRREARSWRGASRDAIDAIVAETREGLWGRSRSGW